MKKTILILSILALIASSCGNKKTPFDLATFPAEWRSLTKENGKLFANDNSFEVLKIEGNKLIRIYYARGEQSDFESKIVSLYQIGDTVVISTKPTNEEFVWDYKFLWLDKDKGLAEWIFNNESAAEIFVVSEKLSEYQTTNSISPSVEEFNELPNLEGTYRSNHLYGDDCNTILHIKKTDDGYSFTLLNGDEFKGKVTISNGGITLEGIPWVSNLGALDEDGNPVEKDLAPEYGIDFMWHEEDGNLVLTMQNSGNSMNSYQKLNCEDKLIALEREK